jgi:ribosomal protein S18 acetylase RimI-like enzyme
MVGFVQFGRAYTDAGQAAGSEWELRRLYVHSDFRNRSIGGRLMEATLAHPDMKGATQITLDVWDRNVAAQRFYARYGFHVIGARPFSVEPGTATSPDLIMARQR